MKKTLKVLDLFAGGGGFSTGFLQANHPNNSFEITRAVELDPAACDTLRSHIGMDRVIQGDVTSLSIKEEIYKTCSNVDVVIGGPPCQTFSLAGPARSGTKEMREKLKNDPRNTLYKHFFEIVDHIKPTIVVFENVEGMLSKKVDGTKDLNSKQVQVIELICDELESKGYTTTVENCISDRFQVLNASDFGVPQHRRRIIIIANRLGLENPKLEPTHGSEQLPYQTVNDAIRHLPVRLPKISLSKKLKNIDVVRMNYHKGLSMFMENLKSLCIKEMNSNKGLDKLYQRLNKEFDVIKDRKTHKIYNLMKFLKLYNELLIEYGINSYGDDHSFTNHQSREHNFRDIMIFIGTKPGSNSSRFMNPLSDDYNEFLYSLYPYNRNKHKDTYVKHSWDNPSNTILAHMEKDGLKFIHPEQPRTLTPYEAQLLQSFPEDYAFCGGRNNQYRQIGNAVPPKLAQIIGESVLQLHEQSTALYSKVPIG